MNDRVVITGMGVVSPYGAGPDRLWQLVLSGVSAVRPLSGFEVNHLQARIGGQLPNFDPTAYLPARLIRKIDRFSVLALVAAHQALHNAGVLLDTQQPVWSQVESQSHRVGLTVGNALGGWAFAERELCHLWQQGPEEVSPFMATAWFPAAAQGELSIRFGIRGIGRTLQNDRASGGYALLHAAECLRRGHADLMLAGGTEAPFSPYAMLCLETSGLLSRHPAEDAPRAYRPFDAEHTGLVVGEGAAFFVLERARDALRRGAPILAELAGWASTADAYDLVQPNPDGIRSAAAMRGALALAGVSVDRVDAVFAAGSGVPGEDEAEARAITLALGDAAPSVPVTAPHSTFGNLLGATLPVNLALAVLALHHCALPPTLQIDHPALGCEDLHFVTGTARRLTRLDTCLLNARGIGGMNCSLVLKRWSDAERN